MKYYFLALYASLSQVVNADILLQGNGVNVSTSDVVQYVNSEVPEERRAAVLSSAKTLSTIVENIYLTRRLSEEGRKASAISKEVLNWELTLVKERLLMNAYIDRKINEKIKTVNWEGMAKEEFLANKTRYTTPETLKVAHILIREPDADMSEILRKLKLGENFNALAREYSQDPTVGENDGELGYIVRGQMVKTFEDMAFDTEVGEVSKPFTTKFGTHILKVNDRKASVGQSFEAAFPSIKSQLISKVRERFRRDILNGVRAEQGAVLDKAVFDNFLEKHKQQAQKSSGN